MFTICFWTLLETFKYKLYFNMHSASNVEFLIIFQDKITIFKHTFAI